MLKSVLRSISANIHWKKHFRFYLAGPISYVTDESYMTWRVMMEKFLKSIGHEGINPLRKYASPKGEKVKVEAVINQRKVTESAWRAEVDLAREYLRRRIINPDIELLEQSDAIIAYVPNYSMGTSSEIFYAYEHGYPVYVMTPMPKSKWSGWLVGLSTLIFTNWDDLKQFLKYMEEKSSK